MLNLHTQGSVGSASNHPITEEGIRWPWISPARTGFYSPRRHILGLTGLLGISKTDSQGHSNGFQEF